MSSKSRRSRIDEGHGHQWLNRDSHRRDQYSDRDRFRDDSDYPRRSNISKDRNYRRTYNRPGRTREEYGVPEYSSFDNTSQHQKIDLRGFHAKNSN